MNVFQTLIAWLTDRDGRIEALERYVAELEESQERYGFYDERLQGAQKTLAKLKGETT